MAKRKTTRRKSTTRAAARGKVSGVDVLPGTDIDQYLAPWLIAALLPFAGAMGHRYAVGSAWQYAAPALLALGGAGMGMVAWADAKPRKPTVRWRVVVTVVGGLWSLGLTIAIGPVADWLVLYAIGAGLVALAWNVIRTPAVRGMGEDAHEQADTLAEQLGLPHLKARKVSESGPRHVYRLRHAPHTAAEVQAAASTLASVARIPPTGVRVVPDPGDAGASEMTLVTEDVLRDSEPWPGPSRPGASCADPCRIGRREDGGDLEIVRPGDPKAGRNSTSVAVGGMPGAAKTTGVLCEVAELVTRRDVVIWWSDTSKPDQTVPAFRPAIDWLATSKAQTRSMIGAVDRVITARSRAMGAAGFTQWTPEVFKRLGIPYLVVYLEESARVMEDLGDLIIRTQEAVRSAGISLTVSMQRHSSSNMPTDLRSNLGMGWCFGCKDAVDAQMVLSEETVEAGAKPWVWKVSRPGACYLEATHVAPDDWSMPARTFDLQLEQLRAVVAEWAPRMALLDQESIRAAGPDYARQVRDRAMAGTAPAVPSPPPVPAQGRPQDESGDDSGRDEDDEEMEGGTMAEDYADAMREVRDELADDPDRAEDEDDLDVVVAGTDPRVEVVVPAGHPALAIDLSGAYTPGPAPGPADRDRLFAGIIGGLLDAHPGGADVTTQQLLDAWLDIPGMTLSQRPALTRRVRKLVDAGAVEDLGRGRWRLLPAARDLAVTTGGDDDDDEGTDRPSWSVGAVS